MVGGRRARGGVVTTPGVELRVCRACGHVAFPRHLLCRVCAGASWRTTRVYEGRLEGVTVVRRSVGGAFPGDGQAVGLVVTDAGARIVARLGAGLEPGTDILLSSEGTTPVAVRSGDDPNGTVPGMSTDDDTGAG
jgi:hypothetical protein